MLMVQLQSWETLPEHSVKVIGIFTCPPSTEQFLFALHSIKYIIRDGHLYTLRSVVCKALPETFPTIYESFTRGGFVVRKRGSLVLMDQALHSPIYNSPQKVKEELLVCHIENRLFPNGTLQDMRRQNIRTLCMNVPA